MHTIHSIQKAIAASSQPKILHLFNSFLVGGVENQHLLLVQSLRGKFEQYCWALDPGPIESKLDTLGIPHCCGPGAVIKAMLENARFDCIVVRTNRIIIELAEYLRCCGVPIVYTRNYLRWSGKDTSHINPKWEHLGINMADYCLFSSPSLKHKIQELIDDIPGGEVIYNALDLEKYPLTVRQEPPSHGPFRIGMLANLWPNKNQLTAIQALESDLKKGRYSITIAGAPYDKAYAASVNRAAVGLPVKILGWVDDPVDFFNMVDVLLVASDLEGWPNVIMEAFACGVPVVSTNVGDISELFGPKPPGRIYPPKKHHQIAQHLDYIRQKTIYKKLSLRAINRAKDFDLKNASAILEKAILSVMTDQAKVFPSVELAHKFHKKVAE